MRAKQLVFPQKIYDKIILLTLINDNQFTDNSIMTIAEQIYAIVKSLPQEQADKYLALAEFIRAKHFKAN